MRVLTLNPPFLPRYSRQSRSPSVCKGATFYYPYYLAYATGNLEKNGFDVSLVGKKSGEKYNPGVSFTIDDNIASEHAIWGASKGDFSNSPANSH